MKDRPALYISLFFAALGTVAGGVAHASPLNYATAEFISLTSPATTLTIATGSAADVLQVNAASVVVTLSSSTGGTFTLVSPAYDLAVATSSGGGTATASCTQGVASATISQITGSTLYTITASGTTCANSAPPLISNIAASGITTSAATITWTTNVASTSTISYGIGVSYGSTSTDASSVTSHSVTLSGLSAATTYHFAVTAYANNTSTTSGDNTFTTTAASSGGGGGGGGGGGSGYYIPIPSATTSTGSSVGVSGGGETLNELLVLLAKLRTLAVALLQISGHGRPLTVGAKGIDVWALQVFLSVDGKGPASSKLAAIGPTSYFGPLTAKALAEYQSSVGIAPASGYFGPKTNAYLIASYPQSAQ